MISYYVIALLAPTIVLSSENCCRNTGCKPRPYPFSSCTDTKCKPRPYPFTYDLGNLGPDNWPLIYTTCAGSEQSPINIDTTKLVELKAEALQWNHYYFMTPDTMILTHNGHELVLQAYFGQDCSPTITGGPLYTPCKFHSITFHWGQTDMEGSEHTLDESSYPMEMQMIHTCNAEGPTRLLIIAYIFQITLEENKSINNILQVLNSALRHPYHRFELKKSFSLASLAIPFSYSYATYIGSITIPPCTEGVRWIVYPYPLDISKRQIVKFRKVRRYAPELNRNFRPVQPLNSRRVFYVT